MKEQIGFIAIVAIWNIVVFALYGIDKHKAKKNKYRISENTLIGCAFLFGGVGATAGMQFFRHKTKHSKFRLLVPIAFILNVGMAIWYYSNVWEY